MPGHYTLEIDGREFNNLPEFIDSPCDFTTLQLFELDSSVTQGKLDELSEKVRKKLPMLSALKRRSDISPYGVWMVLRTPNRYTSRADVASMTYQVKTLVNNELSSTGANASPGRTRDERRYSVR